MRRSTGHPRPTSASASSRSGAQCCAQRSAPLNSRRRSPPRRASTAPGGQFPRRGRRRLPFVRVAAPARDKIPERLDHRAAVLGGDALREIQDVDGVAETIQMLRKAARELAPALTPSAIGADGDPTPPRCHRRPSAKDTPRARPAFAPRSPGQRATSPRGSARSRNPAGRHNAGGSPFRLIRRLYTFVKIGLAHSSRGPGQAGCSRSSPPPPPRYPARRQAAPGRASRSRSRADQVAGRLA
jgi:hypothetical protein